MSETLTDLVGLDRESLANLLEPHGLKGYRIGQIWQQIYRLGALNFDSMTTIAKSARQGLAEKFFCWTARN